MRRRNGSIVWFDDLTMEDLSQAGLKNASLGELKRMQAGGGVNVPEGFATTSDSFQAFLNEGNLRDHIQGYLFDYQIGKASLEKTGRAIRRLFSNVALPAFFAESIRAGYRTLSERCGVDEVDVAVRSSITCIDEPDHRFSGQQETFLNVVGEHEVLDACRKCLASVFTDRAIAYREAQGIDHMAVGLSIGVQKMVRAGRAGSGVIHTYDPETGFPSVIHVKAGWGLGENVVHGTINPDRYEVFKPLLAQEGAVPIIGRWRGTKENKVVYGHGDSRHIEAVRTSFSEQRRFVLCDEEILQLARWGVQIEGHFGRPVIVEWAKDAEDGLLYVVQATPVVPDESTPLVGSATYTLVDDAAPLLVGLSVGSSMVQGRVIQVFDEDDLPFVTAGSIVVAPVLETAWLPGLKKAAGIVTDSGDGAGHVALVSRELGIPAVVGAAGATHQLNDGQPITLHCVHGEEGRVYDGTPEYEVKRVQIDPVPQTDVRITTEQASPESAFKWWQLPVEGGSFVHTDFIFSHHLRVHPLALLHYDTLDDEAVRREIRRLTRGYENHADYLVDRLVLSLARIAASKHPRPVFVQTSNFTSSGYAALLGGHLFEPKETNPAMGRRGVARYVSEAYAEAFALELHAIQQLRDRLGFRNVNVVLPFCRTPQEADEVLAEMARHGLRRGDDDLRIFMACDVPANLVLVEEFAERFDGFTLACKDLARFVLGLDDGDVHQEAVVRALRAFMERVRRTGRSVMVEGDAISEDRAYVQLLAQMGVEAISVHPSRVLQVKRWVAEIEGKNGQADTHPQDASKDVGRPLESLSG